MSQPIRQNIQELEIQKFQLEEVLKCIKREIEDIHRKAEGRISLYLYLLILLGFGQIGFFYYTIFEVDWLGWDVMEPLTYSVELFFLAVSMRFYLKYGRQRSFQGMLELHRTKFIKRNPALRYRYNKLEENQEELENDILFINKSIEFHKARHILI